MSRLYPLHFVSRTVMLSFARYSHLVVHIYLAVIISRHEPLWIWTLLSCEPSRCGIAYNHYGGHNRETNKNISNVTQSALECHVPQSNSARTISNTMRRRKYVMLLCVKLKGESMPRERASRNWHVKTPQSCPFSCCGVSRGQ